MKKLSTLTLINMNPNKLGALEEYAFHLSTEIIRRGHFAAVGFSEYPPAWFEQKFKASGIDVLRINPSNGSMRFIMELRKAIEKHDLNIIHATFYPFYSIKPIIAAIGKNVRLIYSDQESRISHPQRSLKSLGRHLRNKLYQRYIQAIIADAQFIKECQIKDHFTNPDKVPVIYNGVNLQRFKRADPYLRSKFLEKFNIFNNSSVIVTIAQCIWAKGLDYFIDAANFILKERPNTIFFVVGDGPERSTFQQKANDLGLKYKLVFTGVRVDTEEFLSVADVFVLLSVWEEAFAFTLLEAMASSCPVVATRVGAIPESILDGVTGILVPPRDSKAAANAILKLLNDDELRLRMGSAGRKRVEEHFSLEQWVNKTIELYEKAIES